MSPYAIVISILAAGFALSAAPASADIYRILDRRNSQEIALLDCAQSPSGRTLAWARSNCKATKGKVGPIADVLYSAAGNSADYLEPDTRPSRLKAP